MSQLTDDEYRDQIKRCFDVFGQALFLTIKAVVTPSDGGVKALRQQWRNLANEVIKLGDM